MTEHVFNMKIIALAALIPLLLGMIWYSPKVFGKAWMSASGMTDEKVKGANMPLMLGLTFILSIFIGLLLANLAIHQNGIFSLFMKDDAATNAVVTFLNENLSGWENRYRNFQHGAVHGFFAGFLFGVPLLTINALYERKNFKYIAINGGYWLLSLLLMGGVICQFS